MRLSPIRSRARLSAALLPLFLLPACGGGDGDPATEVAAVQPAPAEAGGAAAPEGLPLPEPAGENEVGVRLREYKIDLTRDTVAAGTARFHVVNGGRTTHMLIVRNEQDYSATAHLEPGDSAILEVALEPGEYRVLCDVRDEYSHLSEGMLRTLVVR